MQPNVLHSVRIKTVVCIVFIDCLTSRVSMHESKRVLSNVVQQQQDIFGAQFNQYLPILNYLHFEAGSHKDFLYFLSLCAIFFV